jgi:hypothetical protein
MLIPHATELDQMLGLAAKTEVIPGGMRLTVKARDAEDAKTVARVRGLRFIGLLTLGAHHRPTTSLLPWPGDAWSRSLSAALTAPTSVSVTG